MTRYPSDGELRAASTALMAARFQEDLDDLEARLAATWRGRLALRLDAATRPVRCRWEYWNSSTQRQVRYVSGFWEIVGLLAASTAIMIGIWAAFLNSVHR